MSPLKDKLLFLFELFLVIVVMLMAEWAVLKWIVPLSDNLYIRFLAFLTPVTIVIILLLKVVWALDRIGEDDK